MIQTDITNIGDPFILLHGDTYYLYATSSESGFCVWSSRNLTDWQAHGLCYTVGERSFGYKDFWAPEVVYHNGQFIMHYTAKSKEAERLLPGVAAARSPLGPFTDVHPNEPLFDLGYAAIDGHVFSEGGKHYFFYTKDVADNIVDGKHTSELYQMEMTPDLFGVVGEPKFVCTPDQPWETGLYADWRWNEGPTVVKRGGKYYLTYSGNCYDNKLYGVGCAVAERVSGPYVKYAGNPVLKFKEGVFSGPGHNCIFTDAKGNDKAAFHIHTQYEKPTGDRRACICDIKFHEDHIEFCV